MMSPLELAGLASASYQDKPTIEAGNAHVAATIRDGVFYPAFRGSATRLDWYSDFGAIATPGIYGSADLGRVHPMFFADACAILPLVLAAAGALPIWPIGHSKGGGDAELLAALLVCLAPGRLAGYTSFGKPRTAALGNVRLAALLGDAAGADYRHNHDPVPLVPGGFVHVRPTTPIGVRHWLADLNPFDDHFMAAYQAALALPAQASSVT